jgi:type VI secretion system secreted protein VgrG
MSGWSRDKALLALTSPLGPDALVPTTLIAQEAISTPFQFRVNVVSQIGPINPDDLLNHPVCLSIRDGGTVVRYFHGIVQQIVASGDVSGRTSKEHHAYELRAVPRLWFLSQTVDCRVYQNLSVPDILRQLFADAGLQDQEILPQGSPREYTIQFNESDLHFATRLMEEEGYFYFFRHTDSAHKLIIADQNSAFVDIPGAQMHLSGVGGDDARVVGWTRPVGTTRGKFKLKDYDPTQPDTLLQQERPTTLKTGGAPQRDAFRWPALTFKLNTVKDRSTWSMEAAEAAVSLYHGGSRFAPLFAGGKFTIETKPSPGPFDGTYALRSVDHHAVDDTWLNQGAAPQYSNTFSALPFSVPWRQPIATPRPRMEGIHTALVLGPQHGKDADIKSQDGEEIHTDDLGRVKVRFYWDHRGEATGGDAVWARVIQPWAGKGWGAQFIPRVGTEVAVAFVDGDPDRPIVVGGLYNGRDTPIYSKADKTKSGFRSRSSLKGGASEFNELTFDDKKGSEIVYTQAQKDQKTYVKNDQTLTIDNCRIVTVKKDETVDIQNNQSIKVKMDHDLKVTDGNRTIAVSKGNNLFKVDMGNHDVKIAMGNHTTDVQMGNVSLKAGLGQIDNEAMQAIELKVGQSSVKIDQMGVTITGLMIKIEGQVQTQVKGLMTSVNADAMLVLKGAITMVN